MRWILLATLVLPACSSEDDSEEVAVDAAVGGGGAGGQGAAGGAGAAGGEGGQGVEGGAGAVGGEGGQGGAGAAGGEIGQGGEGGEGGAPPMCEDLTLYVDTDEDGYGTDEETMMACLLPDESLDGFARQADDCAADDIWINPGAAEICGDFVDDDCDGDDEACPETHSADMDTPDWDCTGEPPANVYAYAHFADGNDYFQPGGCFIFFEGLADEFYVLRKNLERTNMDPSCTQRDGCTCPSLNGWPAYDRRLYAYTLRGTPDECEPTSILDHGGEDQPVSNACRKYLYQLHFYDIPFNYIGGRDALERRLELYPTVEIACAEDRPHANLPFVSLATVSIERNANFVAQ